MPTIENIDGFLYRISFSVPSREYDVSCYISGNFNCNGDGSVALERNGDRWAGEIVLQPGEYSYFVEIDQYFRCDEKRVKKTRPLRLFLPQNEFYHDPGSPIFYSRIGGRYLVKAVSPRTTGNALLITGNEERILPARVQEYSFMKLYHFILDVPVEYAFEVDGRKLGKSYAARELAEVNTDGRIIYQVFPDRFYRLNVEEGRINAEWNEPPGRDSFYGGNLKGIIEKIDYIQSLGTGMLYLNPVYKSGSNHRYDVDDYYQIDPMLGTMADLSSLSEKLRQAGISIIFDVVFNHTSIEFERFKEALASGDSPFRAWYYFLSGKNGTVLDYECFKDHPRMPKLRLENRDVQGMILDVLQYYGRVLNISFFRFDVADSMNLKVMRELIQQLRMKLPGVQYMAEVWCPPELFVATGIYDSAMNYDVRDNIVSLLTGKQDIASFLRKFDLLTFRIGEDAQRKMLNLVGSHDTERIRTVLKSRDGAVLAYSILYMLNGFPSLYYGDETGLEGGRDPDCRRTYPWEGEDNEMIEFFRNLARFRISSKSTHDGLMDAGMDGELLFIRKSCCNMATEIHFAMENVEIPDPGEILLSWGIERKGGRIIIKKFGFYIRQCQA